MIYLDNAASTSIDRRVIDEMMPFLTTHYGNASSLHKSGRHARRAIDQARDRVARLINCDPDQIIFTSGGSEANSMVFEGVKRYLSQRELKHILVGATEHKSIINAIRHMERAGFIPDLVYPHKRMRPMNSSDFLWNIGDATGLASLMYVNNETGTINDVLDFCRYVKDCMLGDNHYGLLTHVDCVQAAGHIPIDVRMMKCDFLTISGHKIHAPKGIGVLYARNKDVLDPTIHGGESQEFGLRGGTENVANIVAMGKACELSMLELEESERHITELKERFMGRITQNCSEVGLSLYFNIAEGFAANHILSLAITGADAQTLVLMLDSDGVCVSAGSACSSGESRVSDVLLASGVDEEVARSTIRVSFSKMNSLEEVELAADIIARRAKTLVDLGGKA